MSGIALLFVSSAISTSCKRHLPFSSKTYLTLDLRSQGCSPVVCFATLSLQIFAKMQKTYLKKMFLRILECV